MRKPRSPQEVEYLDRLNEEMVQTNQGRMFLMMNQMVKMKIAMIYVSSDTGSYRATWESPNIADNKKSGRIILPSFSGKILLSLAEIKFIRFLPNFIRISVCHFIFTNNQIHYKRIQQCKMKSKMYWFRYNTKNQVCCKFRLQRFWWENQNSNFAINWN